MYRENPHDDDDARFIAAARTLVPQLLDKHDDLTAKVTKLEDIVRRQAMLITKLVREQRGQGVVD